MSSDVSAVIAPGQVQTGNAAVFKERLAREADAAWEPAASLRVPGTSGPSVTALADCGPVGPTFQRVGPGRTLEQRWTWIPVDPIDGTGAWGRPLPPGTVPVTFTWLHAGRGTRQDVEADRRPSRPITVSAEVELTGSDPGLLSVPELADRALADPDFAAWVAADPIREDWVDVSVRAWPDPADGQPHRPDLHGAAPGGVVEIALTRAIDGVAEITRSAWVDPWTGEVLAITTVP
jgi:hypothetical protein